MSLEDKIKKEEKEDNVINYPGKRNRRKGDRRKGERRGGYKPLNDYFPDKSYPPTGGLGDYKSPPEKPKKSKYNS
tara:strand:- start:512 stop:736 length:225 start_codon:yes stop_codon:yes gene_type:complete